MRAAFPPIHKNDFGALTLFSSCRQGVCRSLISRLFLLLSTDSRAQFIGPLTINPITHASVAVGDLLTVTISVTNTVPADRLLWSISSGPAGVTITNGILPANALLTW